MDFKNDWIKYIGKRKDSKNPNSDIIIIENKIFSLSFAICVFDSMNVFQC